VFGTTNLFSASAHATDHGPGRVGAPCAWHQGTLADADQPVRRAGRSSSAASPVAHRQSLADSSAVGQQRGWQGPSSSAKRASNRLASRPGWDQLGAMAAEGGAMLGKGPIQSGPLTANGDRHRSIGARRAGGWISGCTCMVAAAVAIGRIPAGLSSGLGRPAPAGRTAVRKGAPLTETSSRGIQAPAIAQAVCGRSPPAAGAGQLQLAGWARGGSHQQPDSAAGRGRGPWGGAAIAAGHIRGTREADRIEGRGSRALGAAEGSSRDRPAAKRSPGSRQSASSFWAVQLWTRKRSGQHAAAVGARLA